MTEVTFVKPWPGLSAVDETFVLGFHSNILLITYCTTIAKTIFSKHYQMCTIVNTKILRDEPIPLKCMFIKLLWKFIRSSVRVSSDGI